MLRSVFQQISIAKVVVGGAILIVSLIKFISRRNVQSTPTWQLG